MKALIAQNSELCTRSLHTRNCPAHVIPTSCGLWHVTRSRQRVLPCIASGSLRGDKVPNSVVRSDDGPGDIEKLVAILRPIMENAFAMPAMWSGDDAEKLVGIPAGDGAKEATDSLLPPYESETQFFVFDASE